MILDTETFEFWMSKIMERFDRHEQMLSKLAGKEIKDMPAFYYMLDKLSEENGLTVYVTCSADKGELPEFVTKYL